MKNFITIIRVRLFSLEFGHVYEVYPISIRLIWISPRWCYFTSYGWWHNSKWLPIYWTKHYYRCFHFLNIPGCFRNGLKFIRRISFNHIFLVKSLSSEWHFNQGKSQRTQEDLCFVHTLDPKDFLHHFDSFHTILYEFEAQLMQIHWSDFSVICNNKKSDNRKKKKYTLNK